MDWPAQSLDLNLIENLWNRISCIVGKNKPNTTRELIEQVIAAWFQVITPEELKKLVDSLPRRCKLVIDNHEGPIKYYSNSSQFKWPFLGPHNLYKEC